MTIEIANRLQKLRKEKGYSQEQLADLLGISRQAVSKWERAEASPDTDNLICLAKLYGISLDELLNTDQSIEDIRNDNKLKEENKENNKEDSKVKMSILGVDISNGQNNVQIDDEGIKVKASNGTVVDISPLGVHVNKNLRPRSKRFYYIKEALNGIVVIGCVIAYLLLGFLLDLWHPAWIIFLFIPIFISIIEAIEKRKTSYIAFPVIITAIYLFLGCEYSLWHPYWVLFITIPLFYLVANIIDKLINPDSPEVQIKDDVIDNEDNDDDNDNDEDDD